VTDNGTERLPSGWVDEGLGEICLIVQGQSPPGKTYNTEGKGLPFFQGKAEFGEVYPTPVKWCSALTKTAGQGDVLISIRAPVGPTNLCPSVSCIGRGLAAIRPLGGVPSKYVFYALRFTAEILASKGTGSTFGAIGGSDLRAHRIRLAPLPEQHRIVAEIDKQFTRLDAAVAELERAQANLKRYRAAVLRAACEGRLVPTEAELARAEGRDYEPSDRLLDRILKERRAKWEADELAKMRAAGKEPKDDKWKAKYGEPLAPDTSGLPELREGWTWISFDHAICKGPQNGLYKPASAYGDGMPILRIEDYQDGFVRPRDELRRLDVNEDEAWTYGLNPDDLVINRVNSPSHLGKSLVVPSALCPAVFESNMMRMVVAKDIAPRWILLYIRSRSGRTRLTAGAKWAVNQASINQTDVRVTPLPLPPLAEQGRIVAEVERRLSVVEELETSLDHCVKRADRLRQSVLKRAFEGKLVPQNPNDEPASVLLERIRAERAPQAQARNSRPGQRAPKEGRMHKTAASLSEHRTGVA